MQARPQMLKRKRQEATKLAKNNVLPSPWTMIKSGHGTLYRYIRRHEELFGDFTFEKVIAEKKAAPSRKTKQGYNINIQQKHMKTITKIHSKHGRVTMKWLRDNGHPKLAAYVTLHFDMFKEYIERNAKGPNGKSRG